MFFVIRKHRPPGVTLPSSSDYFNWTLHRKDKEAEDDIGEAICRSVDVFASERQTRAAINTAKKAMGGVRFAQTRVVADG